MIKLKEVTAVWYGKFEISCLTSITSILVVIWWNKSIIWACNPGKKNCSLKRKFKRKGFSKCHATEELCVTICKCKYLTKVVWKVISIWCIWDRARQSEIFTEFSVKISSKSHKSARYLARNAQRFQKFGWFLVDKFFELVSYDRSLGQVDDLAVFTVCTEN